MAADEGIKEIRGAHQRSTAEKAGVPSAVRRVVLTPRLAAAVLPFAFPILPAAPRLRRKAAMPAPLDDQRN